MHEYKLGEQEYKFAQLIWENEPIASSELVLLAAEVMNWKKSTTFTMLRRLCERGIFVNESAVVSALICKDEFVSRQSRYYIEDSFGGSLPKFVASFIGGGKLSETQALELINLINEHKEN